MKTEITVDADLELVRGLGNAGGLTQARRAILDKRCCKALIKRLGEGVWEATFQGAGEDGEDDLVVWLTRLPEKIRALFEQPLQIDYREEVKKLIEEAKCQAELQARTQKEMETAAQLEKLKQAADQAVPVNYREEVQKLLEKQRLGPSTWQVMPIGTQYLLVGDPAVAKQINEQTQAADQAVSVSYQEEMNKLIEKRKLNWAAWRALPFASTYEDVAKVGDGELLELFQRADAVAEQLLGMSNVQRTIQLCYIERSSPYFHPYVVDRLAAKRQVAAGPLTHVTVELSSCRSDVVAVPAKPLAPMVSQKAPVNVDEGGDYLLPGERVFLISKPGVEEALSCSCVHCRNLVSYIGDVVAVAVTDDPCRARLRFIGVKLSNWPGPVSIFGDVVVEQGVMPSAIRALWDKAVPVSSVPAGYRRLYEDELVPGEGAFVHAAWLSAILAVGQPGLALDRPFRPIVCDAAGQWYYVRADGLRHPFALPAARKARAIFVRV